MTSQTDSYDDIDFSFEPVPQRARRSFWSVGFVMLGFTFFSASMSVGANLGNGLNYTDYLWAVFIGGIILGAYTGALGFMGAKTGMSFDLLAQRAFGAKGSYLPSFLIAVTQMGWFGVGVAMFARPTAEMFNISPWVIVFIAGAFMTASAYYGIKAIEIVSFISVPLIAGLGTYSMFAAIKEGGGADAVFSTSTLMLLVVCIVLVFGAFVFGVSFNLHLALFD